MKKEWDITYSENKEMTRNNIYLNDNKKYLMILEKDAKKFKNWLGPK